MRSTLTTTSILLFVTFTASATEYLPTGRYLEYSTEPSSEKLIETIVQSTMPRSARTVGDAVRHLLRDSGYRLAPAQNSHPKMQTLLNSPLPAAHRIITPMSLCDALTMLGDEAWEVVYDPINRLVAYQLKKEPVMIKAAVVEKEIDYEYGMKK